ncbi:hypothetical protein NUU61_002741 [Penicillium alfredii]|uniref:HECT-type E3 ubiquitin transferase n=1 Tax=Penicillium alfredii TaxID=1506179 RepID=A0A9W9FSB1_9EURO|nr:uncharacterized protein NUU61_002741 [Penicillium alfredii]KAJ5105394.1 hypothetical protein NUU61_002741 [Penicillium alfredii]
MTRLRGASMDSPDVARSSGGSERHRFYRSKIPLNAPDIIVQNTIDVPDTARVLPLYRDERRRRFNLLVRRYKNQLLYGCEDPGCRTPTCASRRKRTSEGPYRRYTELSARTLACYLASLDDAESGLCCNTPKSSPELTIYDYHRISLQRTRAYQAQAAAAKTNSPPQMDQNQIERNTENALDSVTTADPLAMENGETRHIASADLQPSVQDFQELDFAVEQQLKDPKSFTQSLFDTISLRMVEWLPLRRASDPSQPKNKTAPIGSAAEPLKKENRNSRDYAVVERPERGHGQFVQSNQPNPHPRTPSSRTTGTNHSAVELKFQNRNVKRLSVTEVEHRRQNSQLSFEDKSRPEYKNKKLPASSHPTPNECSLPSPPVLKHRPQKHRGRTANADSVYTKEQPKNQRRVSWDGEKILNHAAVGGSPMKQPPLSHRVSLDTEPTRDCKIVKSSLRPPREPAPSVQTVTHLTPEIIDGLSQIIVESEEEAESWKEEIDRIQFTGSFENPDWRYATLRQREVFPFIAQSVFFVFSSTKEILHSFEMDRTFFGPSTQSLMDIRLDIPRLRISLQRLFTVCPWDIALHSLWGALEKLFAPPEDFISSTRASRRSSRSSTMIGPAASPVVRRLSESVPDEHLSDAEAAHIATIALFVLVSSVPNLDIGTWRSILQMRAAGTAAAPADMCKFPPEHAQQVVEVTDKLEHELGLRLVNRLVRALTARLAYHEISKARQAYNMDIPKQRRLNVLDLVLENLSQHHNFVDSSTQDTEFHSAGPASLIVEWLHATQQPPGGAVQILASMYKERNRLGLVPEDFHTPLLAERLDPLETPVAWVGRLSNNRTMHLLSYSFLFPPSSLVIYFRALNYSAMSKYYESAMTTTRHVTQTAFGAIHIADDGGLLARMKTSMSTYLVLVVRRDNVLMDALNQLWRREKRELMRPLKVQMGMDEGEEGLDHGGVQQEFFRVLMAEALDPFFGMFTMDTRHRVSWFRPCSWEPLYKFELLGLLMSIAVYNGLTLPINFPMAFYRKLLGLKVKHLDHIRDGWPELTQGLEALLGWEEGDVGDVFMRTYEFSFQGFGRIETIDMQKVGRDAVGPLLAKVVDQGPIESSGAWSDVSHYRDPAAVSPPSSMAAGAADVTPSHSVSGETAKSMPDSLSLQSPTPPADEAAFVTNHNRQQFVKDYIFWLTDKSIRPQFDAFARGFSTCLDRSALSIFTPEALKTVVEGIQTIDVQELESHARYEGGFGPDHRVIRDFWSVVQQYPAEKRAQLLEFVTASDRVPVNGISSIMFVIQKNGVGDLRLPTSLTCFGRLLLPEYSSKEALAEKLDKALENARGFGVA